MFAPTQPAPVSLEESLRFLLDQLAELQSALDVLIMHKEATRDQAIPLEVRAELAVIELEFAPKIDEVQSRIAEVGTAIRVGITTHGQTVKGSRLQAVYTKGRISWDDSGLCGFAMHHPELFAFRKEGEPGVAIRKAGK
jgi:hypothetical protein